MSICAFGCAPRSRLCYGVLPNPFANLWRVGVFWNLASRRFFFLILRALFFANPEAHAQHKKITRRTVINEPVHNPRGVVLQTTFDMLGEVVKGCILCIEWMAGKDIPSLGVCLPFGEVERVCRIAMSNLVSGNVFLRSMYLTMHRSR